MCPRWHTAYSDFMRARTISAALIAGGLLAGCGASETSSPTTSTTQGAHTTAAVVMHWSRVVRLHVMKTPAEYSPPIPFGTLITDAQLREFERRDVEVLFREQLAGVSVPRTETSRRW